MLVKPVPTVKGTKTDLPMLYKSVRWCIWLTMCLIQMNVTMSSGLMSSGAKTIKSQLGMMDLEYGCFGGMYAIGRLCGAFLFVSIVNAVNRKYMIIMAALGKAITVIVFTLTDKPYLLLAIRVASGMCHIIPVIYGPIWVNQMCIQKSKYVMSSMMSLCAPLGRTMGFCHDYFRGSENWRQGFLLNGGMFIVGGVIMMFYPSIYFSSKLVAIAKKDQDEQIRPSEARVVSIFNVRESETNERDINIVSKYSVIFTNKVYIFLLLARVVILSINAVFTLWIPNYVTEVLKYTNKGKKTLFYCLMICCGPFTGSFCGSYLTAKVGGYSKKESVLIVLCFNIFAVMCITPSTFVDTWWMFLLFCFCFQIGGSATIPNLNQIILTSIPPRLKSKGYAIANVMSSFFGSVPSPTIYGLINDRWKPYNPRFAMRYFTCYSYVGLLWIVLATIFRYRQSDKEELFTGVKKEEVKVKGDPNALDDIHIAVDMDKKEENDKELQERN